MKIAKRQLNTISPQGKEHKMTTKSKATRTQITDLPENAVELSELEMRIVAGGARSTKKQTNVTTACSPQGGLDWDTDSEWDYSPTFSGGIDGTLSLG
jgi:hypothetical protein